MSDAWVWPVLGGEQHISVVDGERQDSDAHARRGVGPAVDLPGSEGQGLEPFVEPKRIEWAYDPIEAGYFCDCYWQGSRGTWQVRLCHQQSQRSWTVGHTGNATGPHLHLVLWLDGERVRPEDQPEFTALLEGNAMTAADIATFAARLNGYAAELERIKPPKPARRRVIAAELRQDALRLSPTP